MISVIFIWIYVLVTTFLVGYGVLRLTTRHFPYQIKNGDAYVICGLVCVTVYAQFFSLFTGIGLLANLLLCGACAVICFREWKSLRMLVWQYFTGQSEKAFSAVNLEMRQGRQVQACAKKLFRGRVLCLVALFLLFSYGTSRGMIHYDTGLYHAQSIRWIEEYGVVRGLGNLHCRLAYNSASFALSALYSMAFLGKQSFHCLAGFLAFLLAASCLKLGSSLWAGRLRSSDFARVMCIYYLVNIFDEMVSPASDYFMVLLAFYIVIRWLDLLEAEEQTILPYGLLCVLGVFLMTVKLSAALILLLTLYPAYSLLRDRRWKETSLYLGLGFVTALPYFIRNVILSGWLVYPFTQLDLFPVVWKIPKGLADYDAREIQVWGRGYTDVTQFDLPMKAWMPGWFQGLAGSDKVFVLGAAAAAFVLLLWVIGMVCGWLALCIAGSGHAAEKVYEGQSALAAENEGPFVWPGRLLLQGTVAASFLFWLCTSPLIRYGCVYVYLTPAVIFGGIYETLVNGERAGWRLCLERVMLVLTALLLLYKGAALGRETIGSFENNYWVLQKDYENYETISYEIEGVTFYYPAAGDQTGYDSFPSSPARAEISFMGEGLEDGFIVKEAD